MAKENKFWCDRCYTIKLNDDLEPTKQYFSCYRTEQMTKHLASKKHIKEMAREKTDDDILCKYCGEFFSKDAYEIHKNRNSMLWMVFGGKKKCNNFIYGKNRYSSYEKMRDATLKSRGL